MARTALEAPDPPPGFRGSFVRDVEGRRAAEASAGPVRILPAAVASPAGAEDVAVLMDWARREGIPLVPRGAGTGMPGGNVGWGVAVDLRGLGHVDAAGVREGWVEVGPGVRGSALESLAAAAGRFVPPLPSSADRCTVGGMVANNAAGVRSFGYGVVRDWVEELEVVLADGSVRRFGSGGECGGWEDLREALVLELGTPRPAWPRVRKNSSGYALDRFLPGGRALDLLVGSEGTLALITSVRLRLPPAPARRVVALVAVPDLAGLEALAAEARLLGAAACEFLGARFLDLSGLRTAPELSGVAGPAAALALLELDGDDGRVDDALRRLGDFARGAGLSLRVGRTDADAEALWRLRHAASPVVAAKAAEGLVSMQFIEDSVVPDGALARYLDGLEALLGSEETDAVLFGHAGDGNVHVNPLVDVTKPDWRSRVERILEGTVALVAELGGTLSGEHGDGRVRAPFHPRIFGEPAARAFAAVKRCLDPSGILNPGVVVPLPGQDPLEGLSPLGGVR